MIKTGIRQGSISKRLLLLLIFAAIMSSILVVISANFQVLNASFACNSWPFCGAGISSPFEAGETGALVHRLVSLMTWPLVFGATAVAWRRKRVIRSIARPLYLAILLVGAQVGLTLISRSVKLDFGYEALNVGLSLLLQAALISAAVFTVHRFVRSGEHDRLVYRSRFSRLTLLALLGVFAVMVSGTSLTMVNAQGACGGWPLCSGGLIPSEPLAWFQLLHRLFVLFTGFLMVVLLKQGWRYYRQSAGVLVPVTAFGILFSAQAFIGGLQVTRGDPMFLRTLHSITSAGVWGSLTILVLQVGLADHSLKFERTQEVVEKRSWRDFLALTKPIVVLLLLFTTFGGMVVSGQAWPALGLTFWTLVGGAFAAGGSSAVNQYIDRHRDRLMTRTAKRPIVTGKITPAEGLAFGVALCLIAFYLLAGLVNPLAAVLSVAGMIYYVVVYSIWLKDATVQNIVIGGGAGAIPPLVGWAAVSGNLSMAAIMLFVVIFFWTPPHFWALALVRRKEYARAGVPMLPVVRGEKETRWQIFLYTLILVIITLTLPMFGLGGLLYFALAVVLGLWLISSARKVWRTEGNKIAWKMYRHSSMYLAFLFLALMLDAVI
jgi:protoheme IX farnesyltransferase